MLDHVCHTDKRRLRTYTQQWSGRDGSRAVSSTYCATHHYKLIENLGIFRTRNAMFRALVMCSLPTRADSPTHTANPVHAVYLVLFSHPSVIAIARRPWYIYSSAIHSSARVPSVFVPFAFRHARLALGAPSRSCAPPPVCWSGDQPPALTHL